MLADVGVWPIILLLTLGVIGGWREWAVSAHNRARRHAWVALVAPTLAWAILDLHKLTLGYLPSRYLVSFFVAFAVLGGAGVSMIRWRTGAGLSRSHRAIFASLLALAVIGNATLYVHSLRHRRYVIDDTQRALAAEGRWRGQLVMGAWAPTLFWGAGAITKPIWSGYFNDRNILATYRPAAIVAEADQEDSLQALIKDSIDLPPMPTKALHVGFWDLHIYALPGARR